MMYKAFLVKYAEIGIKGKNRHLFEKALCVQMEHALAPVDGNFQVTREMGRIYVNTEGDFDYEGAVDALTRVFGIAEICPVVILEDTGFEDLAEAVVSYVKELYPTEEKTFKVCARRANKNYPMHTMEVNCELGGRILDVCPNLKVDVHEPDIYLNVELRQKIYLYCESIAGPGGMPVGTNGQAMLLLSGGIDSPVAGYMIAKRGVKIDAVYFHAPPYTSERAKQKVVDLAKLVARYSGPIRFELGIKALAPDIKVIAPWRMTDVWTMQSREDELAYCKAHGIDLPFDANHSYSRDRNLWHISHEGLELEDPSNEPNYDDLLVLTTPPEKAPDEGEYVTMTFEAGVPKTLNGKEMKVSEIITELNKLGGKHGIGIVDIVENRVVGMKSRGVYETPGGTILMAAHEQLEELILDRETLKTKKDLGNLLAEVVYEGKWYTPLREAIQAFVDVTQKYVTGEVKFKLFKGNIIKAGESSPYSLYNESLASFTTGDLYDHHDADGFITLFGLPLKVRAMKMQELEKNNNK